MAGIDGPMTNAKEHALCIDHADHCGYDPEDDEGLATVLMCGDGCCHQSHFLTLEQCEPVLHALAERTGKHAHTYLEAARVVTDLITERETLALRARLAASEDGAVVPDPRNLTIKLDHPPMVCNLGDPVDVHALTGNYMDDGKMNTPTLDEQLETDDPAIFTAGDFSFWSWSDAPEWVRVLAPQNGDDITYVVWLPVGTTLNTDALRLFNVPEVFMAAPPRGGVLVYGVHA